MNTPDPPPYAVVTGASTGIGLAAVEMMAQNGVHVFGSVRKQADADRLSAEFDDRFTPLLFDVTDEPAVRAAASEVASRIGNRKLLGLVNNAGIGLGGPLAHQPLEDFHRVVEVNLFGTAAVTQAFLPLLGVDTAREGAPGRIVNVTSISGTTGVPFLGAYCASKHALEGYSESLRRELMLYDIDVIVVAPGHVATPIWDKAKERDGSIYAPTDFAPMLRKFRDHALEAGRKGLPSSRIAEVIWKALTTRRPKTRYEPVPNPLQHWIMTSLLPPRTLDRLMAKHLGMTPPLTSRNQPESKPAPPARTTPPDS